MEEQANHEQLFKDGKIEFVNYKGTPSWDVFIGGVQLPCVVYGFEREDTLGFTYTIIGGGVCSMHKSGITTTNGVRAFLRDYYVTGLDSYPEAEERIHTE